MAEMEITTVDMQDFLDVLYPFLERRDCLELEAFWVDSKEEEHSEQVLIEDLVQFVEDTFIDNPGFESYGLRASSLLMTFDFKGDVLIIDYPDGFETDMVVFRDLNEANDYQEELMDEVDED